MAALLGQRQYIVFLPTPAWTTIALTDTSPTFLCCNSSKVAARIT